MSCVLYIIALSKRNGRANNMNTYTVSKEIELEDFNVYATLKDGDVVTLTHEENGHEVSHLLSNDKIYLDVREQLFKILERGDENFYLID